MPIVSSAVFYTSTIKSKNYCALFLWIANEVIYDNCKQSFLSKRWYNVSTQISTAIL